MARRILAILRARLAAHLGGEAIPVGALLAHASVAGVMCLLARGELAPFGYSLFALTISVGLASLTLLGEFGSVLRADPAGDWSEALPASALERRAASALVIVLLLLGLCLGSLLPAAVFAPDTMGLGARALLFAVGLGQAFALVALLLAGQALFGERAEGFLVLAQTVLVAVAVTGILASLRLLYWLRAVEAGEAAWPEWLSWWPPSLFAGLVAATPVGADVPPSSLVVLGVGLSLVVVLCVPRPPVPRGRKTRTLLSTLLAPARDLARRLWVTQRERGVFDLVYDALPLERDFVLRTYPMIGLPLAFLLVGARGGAGTARESLLALLLFTPAIYLPVLLAHVPTTATPAARWLLDTAPLREEDLRAGAVKALAVRFLLPLYVALSALAWMLAGPLFVLRLALPGAFVSLYCLRILYPQITLDHPLSTAADEIEVKHDWMGLLISLAFLLTILAVVAQVYVQSAPQALLLIAVLAASEFVRELYLRRRSSPS